MKSDEEKLENLIQSKSFEELNPAEKEFVLQQLDSEEEFNALRLVEHSLKQNAQRQAIDPGREVLVKLRDKMREENRHESIWYKLTHVQVPAYATVILVWCACWITLKLSSNAGNVKTLSLTSPALKTDTLYLVKTDTIFKEKIIYRMANNGVYKSSPVDQAIKSMEKPVINSIGVSMKDKEELNKLLVSGSD